MARKHIKVSRSMLFIWFTLAGVIFLLAPYKYTKPLQLRLLSIFNWPLSIGNRISVIATLNKPISNIPGCKDCRLLRNHCVNLEQQKIELNRQIEILSGLRAKFPALQAANLRLAFVSITSISGPNSQLVIDCGQDEGLQKGQFVLADNSIIGTISEISSGQAWVKLFTNSTSRIPVTIDSVGSGRLMQGSGGDLAVVRLLKQKVKIGANVLADKKNGFLKAPMIIGRVAECKRNADSPLLWDITVKPVCNLESLGSVNVIILN